MTLAEGPLTYESLNPAELQSNTPEKIVSARRRACLRNGDKATRLQDRVR